ncbi:MAG TPA: folylpolyglutamate synthase/dihydrofolate synthase family protein, partial [Bacillota bacterium]|nr:folylpolyglutamate synthase/dihydrofolate synthase family protein [Bacillota bacterium]
ALAGNPQQRLHFIHVAGTNGKGSTCAMLESIYRAAGLRVGLFTSPHLVAFGERLQVNRLPISEAEVVRLVEELQPLLRQFPTDEHPTFFEVITVMALRYFAAQNCDLVVWETGLGGRLDATNIVTPLASVITNIQYDHQKWLGETLASIAGEKAGIIKPGIPVITATDAPEALQVIEATARQQNAPLRRVTPAETQQPPLDTLALPLLGAHQKLNAALALATVHTLAGQIPVSAPAMRAGLSSIHWAGRLQVVTQPSGQNILLDGAHNMGGAEILAQALQTYFPRVPVTLVLGILQDKDWSAMCQLLAPLTTRLLLVPVHSERTAQPHGLAEVCRQANPQAQVLECPSLSAALPETVRDPLVVIAGSLYLIGEAMELLHLSPTKATSERGLNEWTTGSR